MSPKRLLRRRRVLASLLGMFISITVPLCAQGQSTVEEYRVKAAFLFHFAQLVEWPPQALDRDGKSLLLCTYGEDPFGGVLETSIEGKQVGSRRLTVRHFKNLQDVRQCQVLFVGNDEHKGTPMLLAQLGEAPVVTVGESDDFLDRGGVIRFCLENSKVRFEINLEAAARARLRISSRPLMLARNVVGKAKD
jgi:hypothetical protein